MYADEFSIYSGSANRPLAENICRYLGTRMGEADVFQFQNENIFVRILENVREQDVFLIQPTCRPVNHSIMELLIMIDAFKRASAGRITAVMPYYAYGRSDKKDQPRVPITARLVADMLTVAGADRVLTMDLHQIRASSRSRSTSSPRSTCWPTTSSIWRTSTEDLVVVSELGFAKKARSFAEKLDAPLAIVEKRRTGNDDQAELKNVIGEVEGKTAVIIDDEINTAGADRDRQRAHRGRRARGLSCATHGVFSGAAIERIEASPLKEVIVTDTIPLPEGVESERIAILSVAPLFGEAIRRIHRGESVGPLLVRGRAGRGDDLLGRARRGRRGRGRGHRGHHRRALSGGRLARSPDSGESGA